MAEIDIYISSAPIEVSVSSAPGSPGVAGEPGADGDPGAAGPNSISGSTATTLVGYVFGNGSNISATAATSAAIASTLVLRNASGGTSLLEVILSGTGGSSFTSTLTGGVNMANRTLVLPDASGTLVVSSQLANSATIAASNAVAVNTIVLRDSAGKILISNVDVSGATTYASSASWTYTTPSAATHRTALGSGATGDALFRALTPAAARETLEINRTRALAVLVDADFYNTTDTGGMSFQPFGSGIASQSASASTANHPGVLRMASGAATNSGARLKHDSSALVLAGSELCEWVFQIQSLSDGVTAYIGFNDTSSQATPTNGVWVQFDANGSTLTCSGKTNAGSTPTTTATAYSASINTWYSLTVEMNSNATVATFTLRSESGTVLWTDTISSNIPTGASQRCSLSFIAFNVNNSSVALSLIDYARMEVNRTLTR